MIARSHVALGAAAWLVAAPHLDFGPAGLAGLGLAAAASLLPDVDHPSSWVGRRIAPVSRAIARTFGHRGITHSAVAVIACAWVLLHQGAPRWIADAVAVGYASHLGADLLTPAGLRLTWPAKQTWSLPVCRTGSNRESVIVAVLVCWAVLSAPMPEPIRQIEHALTAAAHVAVR